MTVRLSRARWAVTTATLAAVLTLGGCGAVEVTADGVDPAPALTRATQTPEASEAASEPPTVPEPTETAEPAQDDPGTAAHLLTTLAVKGRAPMTGYDRARFGQAWLDADRNGCDTRNDILATHLTNLVFKPGTRDCVVLSGTLDDAYTASRIDFVHGVGTLVDIDHVVAMGNAWATGAFGWDIKKRAAFANDPMNLLPVDASANRQKGDGDAATWLPAHRGFRCAYVARQVGVKAKYGLWVTPAEATAIERILTSCPGQVAEPDSGAPIRVDQEIRDPGASAPPTPAEAPGPVADPVVVHYENCDAARAAGAAPVRRGDPGYGSHLDRDGDGVGCE